MYMITCYYVLYRRRQMRCDLSVFVDGHGPFPHVPSVKPRVMTSQSSVNFPKTHLKTAQNSAKHHKKQVVRAVFALLRS